MKTLKFISALVILTGLFSCEAPVTFNEPQPIQENNLTNFPPRMLGNYVSTSDSSKLTVGKKLIERTYDYAYKFHISDLDSTMKLIGDTIFDSSTNEKMAVQHAGDSLVTNIHRLDTLFQISYDNVVRKFKGYYFLNKRIEKNGWEVKKLKLTKNQLIVSSIHSKEDMETLREITSTPLDTLSPRKFETTRKQFKKYLRNDGFSDSEVFVRQK